MEVVIKPFRLNIQILQVQKQLINLKSTEMKKHSFVTITFTLFIVSLIFTNEAQAQRYLSGQKGIQFTSGFISTSKESFTKEPAYYVGVSLATYTKKGNRWVVGVEYLNKEYHYKERVIPVSKLIGDGGYYLSYCPTTAKHSFYPLDYQQVQDMKQVIGVKSSFMMEQRY